MEIQRSSSSTAGADAVGSVAHQRQLVGVAQQGQRAQPEHVRRGLVPGDEQQLADADQLVGWSARGRARGPACRACPRRARPGPGPPARPCTPGSPGPARGAGPGRATGRAAARCGSGTRRGRRRARRAARRSPATGSGSAKPATRSAGGPDRASASRWSATISTMRGSSRRIRRTVNSGVSIRRSRLCSGGSKASRLPARSRSRSASVRVSSGGRNAPALLNRPPSAEHLADVGVAGDHVGPRAVAGLQLAHPLVLADPGHLLDRVEAVPSHVQRDRGCLRHRGCPLAERPVRFRRYASARTANSSVTDKRTNQTRARDPLRRAGGTWARQSIFGLAPK